MLLKEATSCHREDPLVPRTSGGLGFKYADVGDGELIGQKGEEVVMNLEEIPAGINKGREKRNQGVDEHEMTLTLPSVYL